MQYEIPSEATLPFFDKPIAVHWDLHGVAMIGLWLLLVPVAILVMRYGKPKPTPNGIPRGTPDFSKLYFWWPVHFWLLYASVLGTLALGAFAILVSGGVSGTLHSVFAIGTMIFAALQVVSAWFRGSHGGMRDPRADPENPSTWRGDHYDFTPHRRWFEAWHKTGGYFTAVLALGAITSGLIQFWLPWLAAAAVLAVLAAVLSMIVSEGLGLRHDTYQSVYGNHIDHPGNAQRAMGTDGKLKFEGEWKARNAE